jgi:hypothetical protein
MATASRMEDELANLEMPYTDAAEPTRVKERRENALPRLMQSSTLRLEIKRVTP